MTAGRRILILWFACTIAATLAPFDFVYSRSALTRMLLGSGTVHYQFSDFTLNALLFVPFGVSLHREGLRRNWRPVAIVFSVIAASVLLSGTIECLQALLP